MKKVTKGTIRTMHEKNTTSGLMAIPEQTGPVIPELVDSKKCPSRIVYWGIE
jgi:hypothetical protein